MSNAAPRQARKTLGWLGVWGVSLMCCLAGCSKSEESAEQPTKKYEVADERSRGRFSGAGRQCRFGDDRQYGPADRNPLRYRLTSWRP